MRGIEEGLKYYSKPEISVAWTIQLYKALEKVPTLQKHHYEPLSADDALLPDRAAAGALSSVNSSTAQDERLKSDAIPHDRHKIWMAEQGMLQMWSAPET